MAAPAFPDTLDWVNIATPPTLEALKGRIVLLHFWHPAAAECLQSIEIVRRLHKHLDEQIFPICVYSPRYPGQSERGAAIRAAARHHIYHPIVFDPGFQLWGAYEAQSWPTVVLIDSIGELAWAGQGLGELAKLEEHARKLASDLPPASSVFEAPKVTNPRAPGKDGVWFPSGIHVNDTHVFVSDTGRNRVIEAELTGRATRVFGAGTPGHWDGEGINAGFTDPTALAQYRNQLLVADTGNHCIRSIDLAGGQVSTLAGRGERGEQMPLSAVPGNTVKMRFPAGLHVHGDDLYACMAGLNQIWRVNPNDGECQVLSGNGTRSRIDGDGRRGALAMPAALTRVQSRLVIADAATSSIRAARINDGFLSTFVGGGLWDAGFVDGDESSARMQFPTGIAGNSRDTKVWIADTLNHRIRQLDLKSGRLTTVPLEHALVEPTALCLHAGKLWIANSGAHEVLCVNIEDNFACETLRIDATHNEYSSF